MSTSSIELRFPKTAEVAEVLTPKAIEFLAALHRNFNARRLALLARRDGRTPGGGLPVRGVCLTVLAKAPLPGLAKTLLIATLAEALSVVSRSTGNTVSPAASPPASRPTTRWQSSAPCAAAVAVGKALAALATTHQVFVVTHLAQVAALADHHVQFRAAPGVDRVVAARPQHAIRMDRPEPAARRIVRHREPVQETRDRRVRIGIGQAGETRGIGAINDTMVVRQG